MLPMVDIFVQKGLLYSLKYSAFVKQLKILVTIKDCRIPWDLTSKKFMNGPNSRLCEIYLELRTRQSTLKLVKIQTATGEWN